VVAWLVDDRFRELQVRCFLVEEAHMAFVWVPLQWRLCGTGACHESLSQVEERNTKGVASEKAAKSQQERVIMSCQEW